MIEALSILIVICAVVAIINRQRKGGQRAFDYLKPTTTILVILLALFSPLPIDNTHKLSVVVGLGFALLGDIFLLRDKWFVHGLAAFLVAHILFTVGIVSISGLMINHWVMVALLAIGVGYYSLLLPQLNAFKIPVLCYFVAIIVMMHQAISLYINDGCINSTYLLIALSSVLFAFSDGVIAYNKFVKAFRTAEILILSTYWASITLISFALYSL